MADSDYKTFRERAAAAKAEAQERGYDHTMLEKVKANLQNEQVAWIRRFDSYIENLLAHCGDTMRPRDVIYYAATLASLRQKTIEEFTTNFDEFVVGGAEFIEEEQ